MKRFDKTNLQQALSKTSVSHEERADDNHGAKAKATGQALAWSQSITQAQINDCDVWTDGPQCDRPIGHISKGATANQLRGTSKIWHLQMAEF